MNVVASEAKLPHIAISTLSSAAVHDYEVFKNGLIPLLINAKCYLDSAFFKRTTEPFDQLDWNGEELRVILGNKTIEQYSKKDLSEILEQDR